MSDAARQIRLTEWGQRGPQDDSALSGMMLPNAAARQLADSLAHAGMLKITELRSGLALEATAYVGRVQIGDLQITIQPKIPWPRLLRLLRFAYGLRDLRVLPLTSHDIEPDSFQDLLIAQLVAEAREILSRGIYRQYVRVDEKLLSPRGRINLNTLGSRRESNRASLPCTHYQRLPDNIFNRALLAGLQYSMHLTKDVMLRSDLYRSIQLLEDVVAPIRLNREAIRTIRRSESRLTTTYTPAMAIIDLILHATGSSLHDESFSFLVPGFLFDMNRFFQNLISRFLREHLSEYTVEEQYQLHGMLRYAPTHNPRGRRAPTPRPDYIIRRGRAIVAMLDAKYRDLWASSLPHEMLYQVAIYALSREAHGVAVMLYPTVAPEAQEARIDVCHFVDAAPQAQVVVRPVRPDLLDAALFGPVASQRARAARCERLAGEIAFGTGASRVPL